MYIHSSHKKIQFGGNSFFRTSKEICQTFMEFHETFTKVFLEIAEKENKLL